MAETQYIKTVTKYGKEEIIALPTGGVAPHNQAWSTITDTPTTLAGYGITDGGGGMTYPGAGVPKSTGAAWDTSYTTSGTGTEIALTASPTFTGTVTTAKLEAAGEMIWITGINANNDNKQGIGFFGGTDGGGIYARGSAGAGSFTIGNATHTWISLNGSTGLVTLNSTSIGGQITVGEAGGATSIIRAQSWSNYYLDSGYNYSSYDAAYIESITNGSSGKILINPNGGAVSIGFTSAAAKLGINGGLHVGGYTDPGDNNLWIDGIAQEPNFISGWQGNNWQIQTNGDAEFNNVLIRGGLQVYELIINQLHYQNGGLIIGAGAGKVATIEDDTQGAEVLTFHDPEGDDIVPFSVGAIVMVQRVDIDRSTVVKKIVRRVASISSMEITLATTTGWTTGDDVGIFETGDEVCAIGHLTDTNLDSCIYMSATDSNNPFLRVLDGVDAYSKFSLSSKTSVKLQLGNLASLASYDIIPASPGYGLYCDNVYLNGRIVLPSAGMTNEGSSGTDIRIWAGASYVNRTTAPFRVTQNGSMTATGVAEFGTATASVGGKNQNIAIQGPYIWENAYDGDGSGLYLNTKSHAGTADHYRSLFIGDGKGIGTGHNMMVIIPGATQSITFGDLGVTDDTLTLEIFGAAKVYQNLFGYENLYIGGTSEFVGDVDFDADVSMLGNVDISGPNFTVPRKTQTQINAMTPAAGMIVYNTTNGHFYGYTNAWYQLDN